MKYRLIEECCKGYTLNSSENECLPVCSNECLHGKCIAPDTCQCETGYGGPKCDITCPTGFWDRDCQKRCLCQNNSTCDPFNGHCKCARGWKGITCEQQCPAGTYGQDCAEICRCENGNCDVVTGECQCNSGWTGPL